MFFLTQKPSSSTHSLPLQEKELIESTINFWFGTYSPHSSPIHSATNKQHWKDNFHTKWFVPNANVELQNKLDNYIKNKYCVILQMLILNDKSSNYIRDRWFNFSHLSFLCCIIILDQFSRHIYRNEVNFYKHGNRKNVDKCDEIALELCQLYLKKFGNGYLDTYFTLPQRVFFLMPFRHSCDLNNIEFVLSQINVLNGNISEGFNELMSKFKRATLKQLQNVASNAKRGVNGANGAKYDILERDAFDYDLGPIEKIESKENINRNNDDDKETQETTTTAVTTTRIKNNSENGATTEATLDDLKAAGYDPSTMSKNAIKKALKKFKNKANKKKWKNRGTNGSKNNNKNGMDNGTTGVVTGKDKIMNEKIYQTMRQFLISKFNLNDPGTNNNNNNINNNGNENEKKLTDVSTYYVFVSLSGGVDSMVITKLLYYLTKFESTRLNIDLKIVCIHINYGNRVEADDEALFLKNWCLKHDFIFKLKEMPRDYKRNNTKRDEYEIVTRNIRFNFYKECIGLFKSADDDDLNININSGIMLGHHKGDIQENVVSNIMKGCSLLNICGMYESSVINNVLLWRPLLKHNKNDIYHFSHIYGVPYFKDTTPKWSNRGRMRNELIPLLKDIFGNGVLNNLSNLSGESMEINKISKENIFLPYWKDNIKYSNCAAWIDITNILENKQLRYDTFFWKETLRHMTEDILGMRMC